MKETTSDTLAQFARHDGQNTPKLPKMTAVMDNDLSIKSQDLSIKSKKIWIDPPEGWKYGFPAIYDPDTDGQMSEWIVRKGYPLLTIKEYGEQWHIRCWPAEEPEKYPDQVINAQKHSEVIKNTPIGTKMRKTTREEKISKPAVYEVPEETHRKVTVSELMEELAIARMLIRELGDRLAKLEKNT